MPRLLPWLDQRQPDVVCLQETKLTDDAFAELLGAELAERGYAVAHHGEAPVERGRDPVPGRARRRRRRRRRRARASRTRRRGRSRRPAAGSGCTRCTCRTGGSRTPTTTATSWSGWPRCARWSPPGPATAIVCGDMNIAPDRRRRVRPGGVRRARPTSPRRNAQALADLHGARPARRGPRALAGRAGLHLLGLPGRHVPQGPRHADRPGAGHRAGRRPGPGRLGGPPRPQGHRARATTPR